MEDDNKIKILALSEQKRAAPQTAHSKFSVNAHDVATAQDDSEDVMLAMVTKHSTRAPSSHPGDICSVLSQPAKTAKVQVKENEIEINGRTCVRQVQSHDTQCNVFQACCKRQGSLIDRGQWSHCRQ
jgi:hypothetical protein